MNRAQRKAHGRIWGILFLVIPLFLFWALTPVIPADSLTPPVLSEVEEGQQKIPVQVHYDSLLHIQVHRPLASAATGVLVLSDQEEEEQLIGQLEGTGSYSFDLDQKPQRVRLVDLIKENELYTLELK
jgi:hypothetical protein